KALKADLEAMGIEVIPLSRCSGLVGVIHGAKPGKTVALRSDIDGLQVKEETGLPFASTNGNMHACGHDNHMAMLLGAAKILTEVKGELAGTVKLLFQPAEEIAAGARWMVQEGVMEGVDALYGAHIWGNFDAPYIDVTPGNRMAGASLFVLEVEGVSAHGSAPNLGVDAITVAASIINNLQQQVSRLNDPVNPLVLTIGKMTAGSRFNIIANHAVLEGTVRTFADLEGAGETIRRIAEHTAAAFGATIKLDYQCLTEPIINKNEQLNRIAHDAVAKLYGEEGVGHLDTMMGSEDFSELGKCAPYVFGFVGSRNVNKEGCTYTNHHEKYTVDEDVLKRGSAVMAQFAADFLAETAQ
ncbi:MAG: amidohydrolase, partial [Pygmaiobacter sp.]